MCCVCVCRFKILVNMHAFGESIIKEYILGPMNDKYYVNDIFIATNVSSEDARLEWGQAILVPNTPLSMWVQCGDTFTLLPRGRGGMDAGCAPPLPTCPSMRA